MQHRQLHFGVGFWPLLLIERHENHQVRNTGRGLLKTLNFYSPPAFGKDGEAVGPGRPSKG